MSNHNKNNKNTKRVAIIILFLCTCIVVGSIGLFVWEKYINPQKPTEVTYNTFISYVESEKVDFIDYDATHDTFSFHLIEDSEEYIAPNPRVDTFKLEMLENDITVNEIEIKGGIKGAIGDVLFLIIQYGLLFGMMFFVFTKIMGGTDKMEIATESNVTFSDVAGLEEVKESLLTTVDMLKAPHKYEEAGARISKGVLLYGPPGTGKTLIAKAIAGEAGVNFIAVNGSDFDNKYVGVGADKVRKIFEKAKQLSPCILFIDELDAVGCKRSGTDKSYERQTLNQLLSCMDGFSASDGVFIFAATNDMNSLDPALLRPGRFDSCFAVGLPDTTKDRKEIINLYIKNKKVDENVSIDVLAKQTLGCSPAAIEAIINEAAIDSVKNGGIITQENIDNAYYRQMLNGHKKKTSERNESEIKTVAWHEAGHALLAYLQNEEVTKISIVPTTSGAGGVTIINQKKLGMYSKKELESHIRTLYAGRNAELILNGPDGVTTGAMSDIKEATKCISQMVSSYGMSNFGLLSLEDIDVSKSDVLKEMQLISKTMANESMQLLLDNKLALEKIANVLIEKEIIDEKELLALLHDIL